MELFLNKRLQVPSHLFIGSSTQRIGPDKWQSFRWKFTFDMALFISVSFGEEGGMVKLMKTPFHVHDVHDNISVMSINMFFFNVMHIHIIEHRALD